jgi:drug/metabolite transporter (DMT)-like permease
MTRIQANFVLLLAAALWGSGNVFQKMVLEHIDSFTVTAVRGLLAALCVLPLVWWEIRGKARLAPADMDLLLSSAALFAVGMILSQIGFGTTSVTNAGFIVNMSAVMAPLLSIVLFRVAPRAVVWPAAAATVAGAALISGGAPTPFAVGDGYCLLAAAAYSLWVLQIGIFVQRTGRAMTAAFAQFAVTGAAGLGLSLVVPLGPITAADAMAAVPYLLYLGIVSMCLGFLLSTIAQRFAPAPDVAILISAESVFGAVAALMLLGEVWTDGMVAGGTLIMLGVIIVSLPDGSFAWLTGPGAPVLVPRPMVPVTLLSPVTGASDGISRRPFRAEADPAIAQAL